MSDFTQRLSLTQSQRQILTPGLMQMVAVLPLNRLELREMIHIEAAESRPSSGDGESKHGRKPASFDVFNVQAKHIKVLAYQAPPSPFQAA